MFDLNNHDLIITLVDGSKLSNMFVVPIYVRIYKDRYPLTEMSESATQNPASSLRVGFGAKMSIFEKRSFPKDAMFQFDNMTTFTNYDEDKQVDEKYIIFESGNITEDDLTNTNLSDVCREINREVAYYYGMLKEHLVEQYEENRKQRIAAIMAE